MRIDKEIYDLKEQLNEIGELKVQSVEAVNNLKGNSDIAVETQGLILLLKWNIVNQDKAIASLKESIKQKERSITSWIINFEKESREANLNLKSLLNQARNKTAKIDSSVSNAIKDLLKKHDSRGVDVEQEDENDFYFDLKNLLAALKK